MKSEAQIRVHIKELMTKYEIASTKSYQNFKVLLKADKLQHKARTKYDKGARKASDILAAIVELSKLVEKKTPKGKIKETAKGKVKGARNA